MAADRFERTRAAWVLSHAGRRAGARRRGERLMLAATRADRARVSAGDVAATEAVTPGLIHRVTHREDGGANAAGWMLGLIVAGGVTAWAMGPGLLGGWLIYTAWWWLVPRFGPVRITPLAVLAVIVGVACGVSWWFFPTTGLWAGVTALRHAAWWTGAPAFAAWLAHAWGWSAVKAGSSPSATRTDVVAVDLPTADVTEDPDTLTVTATWFDRPAVTDEEQGEQKQTEIELETPEDEPVFGDNTEKEK